MSEAVFLHIGAMKSGTTFLQSLMGASKARLLAAGCLYPGASRRDQVRAAQDVVGAGRDARRRAASAGAWDALVREMSDHPGVSIVSMEFLSFAGARRVRRLLASLGTTQVWVVLTVRDATATIPAHWQDLVRNGSTVSWPEFSRAVVRSTGRLHHLDLLSRDDAFRKFGQAQDLDRILGVWSRYLPPGSIRVVTVPRPGSSPLSLWERFAEAVALDPHVCTEPPTQVNESLGYASTELLRRVNAKLGRLLPSDYDPTLKSYVAARVLSQRASQEPRVRLDGPTYEFGLAWNRRNRDAITSRGCEPTGDLDDLPTTATDARPRPGDQGVVDLTDAPATDAVLAAAAAASEGLRDLVRRRARRLRDRTGAAPALELPSDTTPDAWRASDDPVDVAAGQFAELARTAIDLQARLRT